MSKIQETHKTNRSFHYYLRENIKIARKLCYPREIIEKIMCSKSESEVQRYLAEGRNLMDKSTKMR